METIAIHTPRPRPDVAYAVASARIESELERVRAARAVEYELRIRAQRHADDSHPRYGMSAFDEAKMLLDQHDGDITAAVQAALRRYGLGNGHVTADQRGAKPPVEYSGHEGKILSVR